MPSGLLTAAQPALQAPAGLARRYVAHELRSHLGVVISVASLLDADGFERKPSQLNLLRALRGSAHLLTRLLDDWTGACDEAKQSFGFQFRDIELNTWLNAWCVNYLSVYGKAGAGHALQLRLHDAVAFIRVDGDRLDQCLWNLVSNAFKYGNSPQGVVVEMDRRGDEIHLAVIDHGPGLHPAQLDMLFHPFVRLHPDGVAPGQGLGLALTRLLAGAMQGRVEVLSRPGEGARFTLVFPAVNPAPHA